MYNLKHNGSVETKLLLLHQIAAYGKDFVRASRDTWGLFKSREMDAVVDADMMSSICFLTGICSGSICVIMAAAWTSQVHMPFTATISLLVFFVGYLMVCSPHFLTLHYFILWQLADLLISLICHCIIDVAANINVIIIIYFIIADKDCHGIASCLCELLLCLLCWESGW